jgi:hypothetical protein
MARDETVLLMGEDVGVGYGGGIFGATRGLLERFGPERVFDTPISESGIAGCAVGAALTGYRPIIEFMFGDFLTLAIDQIVNLAAKMRWCLDGMRSRGRGPEKALPCWNAWSIAGPVIRCRILILKETPKKETLERKRIRSKGSNGIFRPVRCTCVPRTTSCSNPCASVRS